MFLGEHKHALDEKGRVILPAKFREPLIAGAYITKLVDGCLAVWTREEFQTVANELNEKAKRGTTERTVARSFFAGAVDVVPDRQGRIPIPQHLREYAGLEREVVVTGAFSRIEIWDADRWQRVNAEGERGLAEGGADVRDIGI
jgi:MraZ protein